MVFNLPIRFFAVQQYSFPIWFYIECYSYFENHLMKVILTYYYGVLEEEITNILVVFWNSKWRISDRLIMSRTPKFWRRTDLALNTCMVSFLFDPWGRFILSLYNFADIRHKISLKLLDLGNCKFSGTRGEAILSIIFTQKCLDNYSF